MKLPVFKAFGMTFALVFSHLLDVIKVSWLAMLAITAAFYWFAVEAIGFGIAVLSLGDNPSYEQVVPLVSPMMGPCSVILLASLIFYPMHYAGLLRFVVRGETPSLPFYLQFGGDELRILGTYVLITLINVGVGIAVAIPQNIIVSVLGGPVAEAGRIAELVITLASTVLNIWIALKLSLAFAAAIGLRKVGVGPSWKMTQNNVWRLLGYCILWGIVTIALFAISVFIFCPGIVGFVRELIALGNNQVLVREFLLEQLKNVQPMMLDFSPINLLLTAASFLFSLVVAALGIAAFGVAYRLMTEGEGGEASEA